MNSSQGIEVPLGVELPSQGPHAEVGHASASSRIQDLEPFPVGATLDSESAFGPDLLGVAPDRFRVLVDLLA